VPACLGLGAPPLLAVLPTDAAADALVRIGEGSLTPELPNS
jgi:hypothetical protein